MLDNVSLTGMVEIWKSPSDFTTNLTLPVSSGFVLTIADDLLDIFSEIISLFTNIPREPTEKRSVGSPIYVKKDTRKVLLKDLLKIFAPPQ